MFGHNPLNYGNLHTLLHNAETRTFRSGTEADWDYDGDLYTIEPADGNIAKLTDPEGQTELIGNADMPLVEATLKAIEAIPDDGVYRLQGYTKDDEVDNSPTTNPNPPSCASQNRETNATTPVHSEGGCGDCLNGFTEDDTGTCVADVAEDTNWMLYGGIAVVVIGAIFTMTR